MINKSYSNHGQLLFCNDTNKILPGKLENRMPAHAPFLHDNSMPIGKQLLHANNNSTLACLQQLHVTDTEQPYSRVTKRFVCTATHQTPPSGIDTPPDTEQLRDIEEITTEPGEIIAPVSTAEISNGIEVSNITPVDERREFGNNGQSSSSSMGDNRGITPEVTTAVSAFKEMFDWFKAISAANCDNGSQPPEGLPPNERSSLNMQYGNPIAPERRKYTQLKDFRRGNLPPLTAQLLEDPEQWFMDLEANLIAQNVHHTDYVSVLLNCCATQFREDIQSRLSGNTRILGHYLTLRRFISTTYGSPLPLVFYTKKLLEKPQKTRTVSDQLAHIQRCRQKYIRAFERYAKTRQLPPLRELDDDLCFTALADFLISIAPNLVAQLKRKYAETDATYAHITEQLHAELHRDPELLQYQLRLNGETAGKLRSNTVGSVTTKVSYSRNRPNGTSYSQNYQKGLSTGKGSTQSWKSQGDFNQTNDNRNRFQQRKSPNVFTPRCFVCDQQGHISWNCPQKQQATVAKRHNGKAPMWTPRPQPQQSYPVPPTSVNATPVMSSSCHKSS
eukprot:GHVQ01004642.1.p1 GENE.GHVQ01004642.1~~GHVQ01004642.1.p1  ORF type:complete len:559 (-),score=58.98 GHVQ01004642.1:483-2159(-)